MCKVTVSTINGVVSPTATNPTQLQITGTLQSCAGNNVSITVTTLVGTTVTVLAGPSPATWVDLATGQWAALLSLTGTVGTVACGSSLTVDVECATDSSCKTTFSVMALPCCELNLQGVTGVVSPGSLEPGALTVTGTALGCFGGQVTVIVSDSAGSVIAGPGVFPADAITGFYTGTLTLTGSVQCDTAVKVDVACAQNTACARTFHARINCPDCPVRAQVSYTTAPCTGTPPVQPVTFSATISVPAGAVDCFRWDYYGDTFVLGPMFTIDNTSGTANDQYQHTEPVPHPYSPGTYTAVLRRADCATKALVENCTPVSLAVNAGCCPITISITSITVGPCTLNGTENVTINFSIAGLPQNFLASLVGLINGIQQTIPPPYPNGNFSLTLQLPASVVTSYSIGLRILSPTGCPDITQKVAVTPCPCCVPTPNLTFNVTGCPDSGTAVVTFQQDPNNPWDWPTACPQQAVTPTSFDLSIYSGGITLYRSTVAALPVSSKDNVWVNQAGNTGPISFPLTGGNFTFGATAHLSGLTCLASTGSVNFQVMPCCPQLTAIGAFISSTDPCTVDFVAVVTGSAPNASYAWTFTPGGGTASGQSVSHKFPPSTTMAGATVIFTDPNCTMPQMTSTTVPLTGCTCPTVSVPKAALTGCVGTGSTAAVSLSTTITPSVSGASVNWTVTPPSGLPFTKTTSGSTTTNGTADGPWTNTGTGTTGALDVTAVGSYAVSVTATGSLIPGSCPQPAASGFAIPACITKGNGSGINWGCVALRWAAAFLFIVAGFSWILYFCAGPIAGLLPYANWLPWVLLGIAITATVAAIAALVIWLLLSICTGKPCRWALLLWWQVSIGFGTTTLYFINCCLWTLWVGLISLTIGTGVLIWWWISCRRTPCEVVIEAAPVLAAVIALIGYAALIVPSCLNPIVGAIVGTVSAGLTIFLAVCAARGTKPSGN